MNKTALLLLLTSFASLNWAQTDFTKHPTNPVLERTKVFGEWDAIAASDPHVLYHNDTLKMWYTGVGWLSVSDTSVHQRVGYAWSLDGTNWTQYAGNPVLDRTMGSWDDLGVETSTVLIDSAAPPAERFKMWYAGQNSTTGVYDLGYAYSPDGLNWTKSSSNPILQIGSPSSWENGFLEGPSVLKVEDTLRMWYASIDLTGNGSVTDFTGNVGYAWSLDGVVWNKHANNPVFSSYDSPSWDQASVADPHVIYNEGVYQMWYAGLNTWAAENFKMGYATSTNGIDWTRPTTVPVLETGGPSEWDREDASYGCVIYHPVDLQYQMWYTGLDTNNLPSNINDYYYEIGYAITPSTLTIKSSENSTSSILFPNPNKGVFYITSTNNQDPKKVEIYDSSGQIVNSNPVYSNGLIEIDLTNFPKGSYTVRIFRFENEAPEVMNIIKN
jgi:predicted GH43/DUF377 family glycosyl hydrolase